MVAERRKAGGRGGAAALALCLACAMPAGALETVSFSAPGADKALFRKLSAASLTLQAQRDNATDPQDLFAAALTDYGRLLGALYAEGYYSGTIRILLDGREAADLSAVEAPRRIDRVQIVVEPGRRFRFGQARMKPYAPGTKLPPAYRDGQVAYSTAIQDAARAGIDGWRALGHAKARVAGQSIIADHRAGRIDAEIRLDAGPRLRFGKLTLTGNERMRAQRIAKIAGYREGEVFDPETIDRMQTRLRRTGIFRSVRVSEAETAGPGDTLGITLDVEEEALRRFGFGAEYSSADGANLSAFWLHRNLFGGGERLRFDALLRGLGDDDTITEYQFGARFERPGTPFTDSSVFALAGIDRSEILDLEIEKISLGIGAERVITDQLTAEAGLSYISASIQDATFHDRYEVLALPISLEWDRRDSILAPRQGSYLELDGTPFWGFGTTDSGTQFTADARIYRSFGADDGVTLAGRLQLGTVIGTSIASTSPDFLFYSGGGGTVRGHPFQSLGVTATRPDGVTIDTGGLSFVGLSGELRISVAEKVGAVAFYDAGYVSAREWFGSGGEWQTGAGIGLRYDTGLGPVRLDIAAPVSGTTGDGVQIYVGIGQAF